MSDWKLKRFWTAASVSDGPDGFAVLLDGRSVKSPAKSNLSVPTRALAEAIAAEWDAQEEEVDPENMPMTRMANSAIDKVTLNHAAVVEMLAEYGDSDLLCYRAASPEALARRQSDLWDPLIDWVQEAFGVRMAVAEGVMHVPQEEAALAALKDQFSALDPFSLTGFHDLVTLSGSLILALAVKEGRLVPNDAWSLSRVDEQWQIEQWGEDDEASAAETTKCAAFLDAARFFEMSLAK